MVGFFAPEPAPTPPPTRSSDSSDALLLELKKQLTESVALQRSLASKFDSLEAEVRQLKSASHAGPSNHGADVVETAAEKEQREDDESVAAKILQGHWRNRPERAKDNLKRQATQAATFTMKHEAENIFGRGVRASRRNTRAA